MSWISTLKLHNFRCYKSAAFKDLETGLIVLHGANGAGKTNILEALSLLSPGRGLRGARITDVQYQNAGNPWAISATVQNEYGAAQLGTGLDPDSKKRLIRINGETVKNQSALSQHLSCTWLTPQMDRLFLESARERRKFLDRLVATFDPAHSGRVLRYENAMRQRSKLLQDGSKSGGGDPAWLESLESQMAETGIAICAARLDFVQRLQNACQSHPSAPFPLAQINAKGTIEELLQNIPALEVEELFRHQLSESRGVDMLTGGAATGPHKSDLSVIMVEKNMPANQCSTGEQKALLIGIILSNARLIAAERGAPPILLLDEVAAHLDKTRRRALYDLLKDLGGQVWLTGTDFNLFDSITGTAQFFEIHDSQIKAKEKAA